jgi:hypothetical protein
MAHHFLAITLILVFGPLRAEGSREQVVTIVADIQRADYEGDRAALKRGFDALAPYVGDAALGSRARYWRGFALWRRSFNGFNDNVDKAELIADFEAAEREFEAIATAGDPLLADAKAGDASCLISHAYMVRLQGDADRARDLVMRSVSVLKEAQAMAPDNPRVAWVLGGMRWYTPPERGGGEAVAIEIYEKALNALKTRKEESRTSDPFVPTWGEPELLMSLAWSHLHRQTPDLKAAESNAQAALKLVPNWHYVRDILMSDIKKAATATTAK